MSLKSLARRLAYKYADEIPATLRSGDSDAKPIQSIPEVTEEFNRQMIEPSIMDGGVRNLELLSATQKRLFLTLDLMLHSGIVTPMYYQTASKQLYADTDFTSIFHEFLKIVHDAEKELAIYTKRLTNVKDLLKIK